MKLLLQLQTVPPMQCNTLFMNFIFRYFQKFILKKGMQFDTCKGMRNFIATLFDFVSYPSSNIEYNNVTSRYISRTIYQLAIKCRCYVNTLTLRAFVGFKLNLFGSVWWKVSNYKCLQAIVLYLQWWRVTSGCTASAATLNTTNFTWQNLKGISPSVLYVT